MKNDIFFTLYRYRKIFFRACMADLRSNYAGTTLGMAWLILAPLLLLGVYSIVYMYIFRARPHAIAAEDYVLHVGVGLVSFMNFAAALTASATSISQHKSVLLNNIFPGELLPVRAVFVSYAGMVAGLIIILVASLCLGKINVLYLVIPIIFVLQVMFSCALGWGLSLLNIALRDTQHFLQFIVVVFMIASPIGYTPNMVNGSLQMILDLNPLAYYMQILQGIIVYNSLDIDKFCITLVISIFPFYLSYMLFRKVKSLFYDYA